MGWANWNHYFCDYDESVIRGQADALVATGMRDLGYKYVLIQECIARKRDANGNLIVEKSRYPSGIAPLDKYIHDRGLQAGIYTDVGPYTCFPNPRYQGSFNHEEQDAATFAKWGMDLIEVDYCNKPAGHSGRELYERMAAAIHKTGRPMLLYICSWGNESPWEWAQDKAQLWRTDADISLEKNHVSWEHVVENFSSNARHAVFSSPRGWNDPDMLEVGIPGLSLEEQRSHFSMWAISAAPLWAAADLTQLPQETRKIFTNQEVLAIDQDPLGAGGQKVCEEEAGLQVWAKPLGARGKGTFAILLLNLTAEAATISVRWKDIGLQPSASARDLWRHEDLGNQADGYSAVVPSHGSVLLAVHGETDWKKGILLEAEWPGNKVQGGELQRCSDCSQGYAVRLHSAASKESSSLTFSRIDGPESGEYRVTLFYGARQNAPEHILIQGEEGPPQAASIQSRIHGSTDAAVHLRKGENSIKLELNEPGQLELDAILLTR